VCDIFEYVKGMNNKKHKYEGCSISKVPEPVTSLVIKHFNFWQVVSLVMGRGNMQQVKIFGKSPIPQY
jgi:hypothetical protein